MYLYFLAFSTMDLTSYIPDQFRSIFLTNALRLSFLEKGINHNFELNARERHRVNSVLSQAGKSISKLINVPESILKHTKFSEVISKQLSNMYHKTFPEVINSALKRAHVGSNFIWNFVIALRTGKLLKLLNTSIIILNCYSGINMHSIDR